MSAFLPRGRHRRRSRSGPVVATGGMAAMFVLGDMAAAGSASAASAGDLARLRQCESGGNYGANTGNGYYGAYQFDLRTWRGLGLSGRPSDASPAVQDAAANRLQSQRGWQPWPGCARKLGLRRTGGPSRVSAAALHGTAVRVAKPAAPPAEGAIELLPKGTVLFPPLFLGHTFTIDPAETVREDVRIWQRQMVRRGWDLEVDGIFGPESSSVAKRFAAEKKVPVAVPGSVDFELWSATWAAPVT